MCVFHWHLPSHTRVRNLAQIITELTTVQDSSDVSDSEPTTGAKWPPVSVSLSLSLCWGGDVLTLTGVAGGGLL